MWIINIKSIGEDSVTSPSKEKPIKFCSSLMLVFGKCYTQVSYMTHGHTVYSTLPV